ncbi:MAG TPA: hypothetical protein VMP11_06000 [Verrucomicrobiae bacterium]|nr:hypothetical protein [Verrucomicrobiae bacterium]
MNRLTPCHLKQVLFLLLAVITVALLTGCEALHCTTCPDAQNQPSSQRPA